MLRITVEVCPGGNESRAFTVAKAELGNLSDLADVSDYAVAMTEGDNPIAGTKAWRHQDRIVGHPRTASVWSLVAKVAAIAAAHAEKKAADGGGRS
jgi:hypothetical protein